MVAASDVTFTPTGTVSSTNVQAAIAEVDSEKAPLASPSFTGTVVSQGATGDYSVPNVRLDASGRPKAIQAVQTSPNDILDLSSQGSSGGWTGTIDFRTSDSAGALTRRARITSSGLDATNLSVNGNKTALGTRATFDTRTDAISATIPSYINILETLGYNARGDYGGATYIRVGTQPSHSGYIRTNSNTVYWELAKDQWIRPEMLGAVGNGSTDDTAALIAFGGVFNAWKTGKGKLTYGKNYLIWPDDTSATTIGNNIIWNLSGIRGLEIDCSGAMIKSTFTSTTADVYVGFLSDCQNVRVRGYHFVDTVAGHVPGYDATPPAHYTFAGPKHWYLKTGSRWVEFLDMDVEGGVFGVAIIREPYVDISTRCEYITVTGKFKNVGYTLNPQNDGDHIRADIKTEGQLRAFEFYGIRDAFVKIESKNHWINDVVPTVYVRNPALDPFSWRTSDVFIHYIDRESSSVGGSIFCPTISQADTSGNNYKGLLENIHITSTWIIVAWEEHSRQRGLLTRSVNAI